MKTISLILILSGIFISQLASQTFTNYYRPDLGSVYTIVVDNRDNMWFGTNGAGVFKFDGKTWNRYTVNDGLPSDRIKTLAIEDGGIFWFGSLGNGAARFDRTNWTYYNFDYERTADRVRIVRLDHDKNVWIGTWYGGVYKFDGTIWQDYTEVVGFQYNIKSIEVDDKGYIWIGSQGDGIACHNGEEWRYFTREDGLASDTVWSICFRADERWFGTENGVSRFDGIFWKTFTTNEGLAANHIKAIAPDRHGNIWCGTYDRGVSVFDGEEWNSMDEEDGLVDNRVRSITTDAKGNVWIGTKGRGVSMFSWDREAEFPTCDISLNSSIIKPGDVLKVKVQFNIPIHPSIPVYIDFSGAITSPAIEMNRKNAKKFTLAFQIPDTIGEVILTLSSGSSRWGNKKISVPTCESRFTIVPNYSQNHSSDEYILFKTDQPLSDGEIESENKEFSFFPNPAEDLITIKGEDLVNARLEIFNVHGNLVLQKDVRSSQEKIDLSAYPKGIYLLRVYQHGRVKVDKIVLR